MHAIFVTIDVKPEHLDAFISASLLDAQGSVRDEAGCFRFDVLRDPANPHRFYLYEVYRDSGAMQAHLRTSHFQTWKSTVEDMLDGEMRIIEMDTVFPSEAGWDRQKPGLLSW